MTDKQLAKLETDYSTPVSRMRSEGVSLAHITPADAAWGELVAYAESEPPAPVLATDDDIRTVIGTLAATLKAPATSTDAGKLKLGVYRKALAGIPRYALHHAANRAIRELEWMPAPSELLKLAKGVEQPDVADHKAARAKVEAERAKEFAKTAERLNRRQVPEDQLADLPDDQIEHAIAHRYIVRFSDGTVAYRTRESLDRWMAENQERAEA